MKKGTRASKNVYDTTSSRFLDSFQGMFHPANADVPFVDRRALFDDSVGSDKHRRVRLWPDELLSSANNNSFKVGGQYRTHDPRKRPRALAYEGGNYGGRQDLKPSSPFSVYTKSADFSSPAKIMDFAGEIAAFESAAQAVSNKDKRESNFKRTHAKYRAKREESNDESAEKRRKQDSSEDDDAYNETTVRESYWERRRKNNVSAKKSRDARKARELQTQIRAAFLERENLRILAQLMIVQQENACLKRVLCAKM